MTADLAALLAVELHHEFCNLDDTPCGMDRQQARTIAARLIAAGVRVGDAAIEPEYLYDPSCGPCRNGTPHHPTVTLAPTPPDALDVERLARALILSGMYLDADDPTVGLGSPRSLAAAIAREYAALGPSSDQQVNAGLRAAAQAYLDAFDMPLTTDAEVHYDTLTAAREALRAALGDKP